MRKWRWVGHNLRKGDETIGKLWVGIGREPEGEEDRRKLGKGPFWRKQENVAKL
jgi:hypothetical protein